MKIAIYGDSFACINTKWDVSEFNNSHLGLSWVEILENQGHEIYNFSKTGSAFMFSYENFLREHKNHDLNIFVVTSPQRVYIKALDGICMFGWTWADSEYQRVSQLPLYPRKKVHLEILKSAKVYLRDWADFEMMVHTQHIIVNNLWNIATNTIVIPVFNDSIEQTTDNLHDVAHQELKLLDETIYNNFDFTFYKCLRKCHFSEENNKVLGNLVINAINNNEKIVSFSKDHIVKPSNPDFSFYVIQREPTKHEAQANADIIKN
jgi:hypothetical protein